MELLIEKGELKTEKLTQENVCEIVLSTADLLGELLESLKCVSSKN
ncbi:hypothetical protein KKG31_05405 [Patescibacteria group bacterium]|nr:hypothetical protein [Patescibacteria group bacterium]